MSGEKEKNGDADDTKLNCREKVCLIICGSLFSNSSCYLRNQTWNSRHSVYYATLLALISLKWQRLLTLSIIFFSGTFKKHQRHPKYVSLASAEKHWILSAAPFI
ncbi:hypothetical protein T10_13581 [Trichinella papuae]|uniref:Uncharacterized protein n=1 Tax=Trichinella papuae TaxID=268474 RepID=A0A0V1M432_9BILA|nr:hypothetical protein T10_13581 [Trichinella papuae]